MSEFVKREATQPYTGKKTSRFKREKASEIYQTRGGKAIVGLSRCPRLNSEEIGQAYRNMWDLYSDGKGHVHPFSVAAIEYQRLYQRRKKTAGKNTRDAYWWKEWIQCNAFELLICEFESTFCDGFNASEPFEQKGAVEFCFPVTGKVVVQKVKKARTKWNRANSPDEHLDFSSLSCCQDGQ